MHIRGVYISYFLELISDSNINLYSLIILFVHQCTFTCWKDSLTEISTWVFITSSSHLAFRILSCCTSLLMMKERYYFTYDKLIPVFVDIKSWNDIFDKNLPRLLYRELSLSLCFDHELSFHVILRFTLSLYMTKQKTVLEDRWILNLMDLVSNETDLEMVVGYVAWVRIGIILLLLWTSFISQLIFLCIL